MAYAVQQDSTDPAQNSAGPNQGLNSPVTKSTGSSSGGTGTASTSAAGTSVAGTANPNGSPAQAPQSNSSGGQFSNLQQYLSANQAGATNLGNQVAGQLNTTIAGDKSSIDKATSDFGNQVKSATNSYDPNLVNSAIANPTAYTNNTNLQTQLAGAYNGPTAWESSANSTQAQGALTDAQQQAQLASTEGGRVQLLNEATPGATSGGQNFNQFLVQNTEPALKAVQGAAAGANPLGSDLTSTAAGLNTAAQQAATTNQSVAGQTKSTLADAQQQFLQQLQKNVADTKAADAAKSDALRLSWLVKLLPPVLQ